jgi:signal peptidase I
MEKETLLADKLGCNDKEILAEMWQEAYQNEKGCSFRVVSGSMRPMIEVGDIVRIIRVSPSSIHTGDVAAFHVGKKIVVHRIIGKSSSNRQTRFRHMGDACRKSGKFLPQHLIGKVKAIEKEGYDIRLDSLGNTIGKKLRVWRLLYIETVNRLKNRHTRVVLLRKMRPLRKFSRSLLLRS